MRLPLRYFDQATPVIDDLADREGLNGAARHVFLLLLRDAFGFNLKTPGWAAATIGVCAAGVALFGILIEPSLRENIVPVIDWILWMGVVGLGAALAFAVACARRASEPIDREIEWRTYCLLVRPQILSERPGLLDRNLADDYGARERMVVSAGAAVIAMLQSRRSDLWVPAAIGWTVGSMALIIWRVTVGPSVWPFALPILGMTLFLLAWCMIRLSVFRRIERAAREKR